MRELRTKSAPPSYYLINGVMAELAAVACLVAAGMGRSSPLILFAVVGWILGLIGGILVLVGTIRWAIWPLIEKAEERD